MPLSTIFQLYHGGQFVGGGNRIDSVTENNRSMWHIMTLPILEAQWAEPVLLTCHFVLRKLYTEPFISASCQLSINLAKWL